MIIKILREKDVLTNQEKDVIIKVNTILRFKSFVNYKNERIKLYDYSRIVTKNRVINIHVKKR